MNGIRSTGDSAGLTAGQFCGHCGEPEDGGSGASPDLHLPCRGQLVLEPPRYCAQCRRRMKVQVTPLGWAARCSRHGVLVP